MLDVCAFVMTRIDQGARTPARLTFAMARHAVVDLCAVFRLKPTPPTANRLPPEEERRLETFLAAGGVTLLAGDAAGAKLTSLRATYEPYAHALSTFLATPLPAWARPFSSRAAD